MLRFNFHLIAMVANALYKILMYIITYIEIYHYNIFLGFFFKIDSAAVGLFCLVFFLEKMN